MHALILAGTLLAMVIALLAIRARARLHPRTTSLDLENDAAPPAFRFARGRGPSPAAAAFARALLRNPRAVGACCPSSVRLARTVAAAVDPSAGGLVVELGGGTGAITAALLQRGVPPERLVVIERDPSLASHLKRRFGEVRVIAGDARELASLLARRRAAARVACIVSSLPMMSLSRGDARAIGAQICAVLEHGGLLVQYTYQMGFAHERVPACLALLSAKRVWVNLPPARVEVYRHDG